MLLLDLLAPGLAGAPLLVVGALRPHDPGTDSRAQDLLSRVGRRGEVLELSGLGVEARAGLGKCGGELADAAVVALQERTEGNPFFVQSLARVLGDATDPGWPFPLPTGVRDTIASNAERARVSVTRAIRSAIEALEDHHQELGSHLTASVRTGTHCRYAPAAGDEVAWRVERSSQAS